MGPRPEIPDELYSRAEDAADERGYKTTSEFIRQAVRDKLDSPEGGEDKLESMLESLKKVNSIKREANALKGLSEAELEKRGGKRSEKEESDGDNLDSIWDVFTTQGQSGGGSGGEPIDQNVREQLLAAAAENLPYPDDHPKRKNKYFLCHYCGESVKFESGFDGFDPIVDTDFEVVKVHDEQVAVCPECDGAMIL